MGVVVGHELTHGFDDQGAQYDAEGNLKDWWQPDTEKQFKQRTQCVIDQYCEVRASEPGVHLNGANTVGENIADIGGVKLALAAYRALRSIARRTPSSPMASPRISSSSSASARRGARSMRPDYEKPRSCRTPLAGALSRRSARCRRRPTSRRRGAARPAEDAAGQRVRRLVAITSAARRIASASLSAVTRATASLPPSAAVTSSPSVCFGLRLSTNACASLVTNGVLHRRRQLDRAGLQHRHVAPPRDRVHQRRLLRPQRRQLLHAERPLREPFAERREAEPRDPHAAERVGLVRCAARRAR